MGSSESSSQNRPGVEYLLAQVISILTQESPSQQQLEQALALLGGRFKTGNLSTGQNRHFSAGGRDQ
jgi:hypothetical protein